MKIHLTESQINRLLNESFSRYLYHFTTCSNLYNMLKMNAFILTPASSTVTDIELNKGYPFYMSFTRQHTNKVGYPQWKNFVSAKNGKGYGDYLDVRITVNGQALGTHYVGMPVNYHYKTNHLNNQQKHLGGDETTLVQIRQSEDRLLSNTPIIWDIGKYIERIDILLRTFDNRNLTGLIYRILRVGERVCPGKIFILSTERDFNMPRTENILNDKILSMVSGELSDSLLDNNSLNNKVEKVGKSIVGKGRDSIKLLAKSQENYAGAAAFVVSYLSGEGLSGIEKYIDYIFSNRSKYVGGTKLNAEKNRSIRYAIKLAKTSNPLIYFRDKICGFLSQSYDGTTRDLYVLMSDLFYKLCSYYNVKNIKSLISGVLSGKIQIRKQPVIN